MTSCAPRAPTVRPATRDSGRTLEESDAHCTAPDAARPEEDAATLVDARDERTPDFQLRLLDPPLSIAPGETSPLRVRIERVGGFDAPVLIDLWGLPDTVWAQARESRVGDDVLEVSVEVSEDALATDDTPFAVQASALGIRRVVRTTLSIR